MNVKVTGTDEEGHFEGTLPFEIFAEDLKNILDNSPTGDGFKKLTLERTDGHKITVERIGD